jgi:hypothetical protein
MSSPLRLPRPAAAFCTPPTKLPPIDAPNAPKRVARVNPPHQHRLIPLALDDIDFEPSEYSLNVPISSDFVERMAKLDYY